MRKKNGKIDKYAHLRGMTFEEYRDVYSLPKWNMDEKGRICSESGNFAYEITEDFCLRAVELKSEKVLKSISAKSEPNSAEEFKRLKKEAADFYKKRTNYIKKMYVYGETISSEWWINVYCNNAIMQHISEKVMWCDASNECFICENGAAKKIDGSVYSPIKWVSVAHIIDMDEDTVKAWQDYFMKTGKKLLIEQVWEPRITDIDTDIFENVIISKEERNRLKQNLKQKSIEVRSEFLSLGFDHRKYKYEFSDTGLMLIGEELQIEYSVDEASGDMTLKKVHTYLGRLNRELNSSLFELRCACMRTFIKTNNVEAVVKCLELPFTLAQIGDFTRLASENKATDVIALLLDFKNKNFADFDFMDEFMIDL